MNHIEKIEKILESLSPRDRVVALEVASARALAAAIEADNQLREKFEDGAGDV